MWTTFFVAASGASAALAGLVFVALSVNISHIIKAPHLPPRAAATIAGGAALGVASGACAGLMVILWCPVAAPVHMAIGHVLPIVALAMIGSVLGHHVIALRARVR